MTGTTTYNYGELDGCVEMMKATTQQIQDRCTEFSGDVRKTLQTWSGETAASYEGKANNLNMQLEKNKEDLNSLGFRLQSGAESMKLTDKKSAQMF